MHIIEGRSDIYDIIQYSRKQPSDPKRRKAASRDSERVEKYIQFD